MNTQSTKTVKTQAHNVEIDLNDLDGQEYFEACESISLAYEGLLDLLPEED
jgi:hypothetical protein